MPRPTLTQASVVLALSLSAACSGKEDKAEKPAFEKLHDALEAYGACVAPEAEPEELFAALAGRCLQARPRMEDRVVECQETLRNAVLKALEEARFAGRGKVTGKLEAYTKGPATAAPLAKGATCVALAGAICDEQKGWLEALGKARGEPGKTDPARLVCRGKKAKAEAAPAPAARLTGEDGQQKVEVFREGSWASAGSVPAEQLALGVAAFDGGAWLLSTRVPATAAKDEKKKPQKKGEPVVAEAQELEVLAARLDAAPGGAPPIVAAERPKLLRAAVGSVRATKDGAVLVGGDGGSLVVIRLEGGKLTVTSSDVAGVGGAVAGCADGAHLAALADDRKTLLVSADGGATFTRGATLQIALGDPALFCRGAQVVVLGRFGDRAVATTCEGTSCALFADLPGGEALGRAAVPQGVGLLRADGLFVVPLPAPSDKRPPRAKVLLVASELELPKGAQAYRVEGTVYSK